MSTFLMTQTMPCFVTWVMKIEADTKEAAIALAKMGQYEVVETTIGDSLDGYESVIDGAELG